MDLMVTLAPVFTFIQTWILGPIKTITGINSVITRLQKVYEIMKNMFKRKTDKEKKEEPCSSKDTSKRTKVKTVGKTTDNHTPHVSATGIRADRGEDVLDALKGIDELETVGQERGSADTVETTGIDLRRRQRRPEEGMGFLGDEPQNKSFKVTGIKSGHAKTVTAVGVRF